MLQRLLIFSVGKICKRLKTFNSRKSCIESLLCTPQQDLWESVMMEKILLMYGSARQHKSTEGGREDMALKF